MTARTRRPAHLALLGEIFWTIEAAESFRIRLEETRTRDGFANSGAWMHLQGGLDMLEETALERYGVDVAALRRAAKRADAKFRRELAASTARAEEPKDAR